MKIQEKTAIAENLLKTLQTVPISNIRQAKDYDTKEIIGTATDGIYNELGFLKYLQVKFVLAPPVENVITYKIFPHEFNNVEGLREIIFNLIRLTLRQYNLELEKLAQCELFN